MKNIDKKDKRINKGVMDLEFDISDRMVFDIGLNSGSKAAAFLKKGARVVGFEPQLGLAEGAKRKFKNQISNKKMFIENIALSSEVGESDFYKSPAHTLSSMSPSFIEKIKKQRFAGFRWNKPVKIKTCTLDNQIRKHGVPFYVKIDVEGHEYGVLKGLTRPIEYISIEYTPEDYRESEKCIDYLLELNNGECRFNYVYRENDHYYFDNWIGAAEIKNYLSGVNDYVWEFGDIYIHSLGAS